MELIKEAGLNTLLGMGTTFVVLIMLSLIISLFGKVLSGGFGRAKKADAGAAAVPDNSKSRTGQNALAESDRAQGAEKIQAPAPLDGAGAGPDEDPALLAVLSAAVAAYEDVGIPADVVAAITAAVARAEGDAPALHPGRDGFAARKIRKIRRRVA